MGRQKDQQICPWAVLHNILLLMIYLEKMNNAPDISRSNKITFKNMRPYVTVWKFNTALQISKFFGLTLL